MFNILNMRSVSPTPTDASGRARILEAAFRLFATRGFEEVSGRAIAKEAGVSAALVIHHFGSVAELRRVIDRWVLDTFHDWMNRAAEADSAEELLDGTSHEIRMFFRSEPLLGGYLRQLLIEGGDTGYAFFEELFVAGREMVAQLGERGLVRPAAGGDEDARLMLLLAEDLGIIMLEPFLSRLFAADLYSDAVMNRWHDAELDLHTNGLFAIPASEGSA